MSFSISFQLLCTLKSRSPFGTGLAGSVPEGWEMGIAKVLQVKMEVLL